jgi:hypothetical protein
MTTRAIRTESQLAAWFEHLKVRPLPLTVTAIKGEARTQQQNRTLHMWFREISQEIGDEASEVKGFCKGRFGLPIVRRDNPEWVKKYAPMYIPLNHELRIGFFAIVPMTRDFKLPQMMEIMDEVQRYYLQQGIRLTDPDPMSKARQ